MFLFIHVRLPLLIMQTRKWLADCKVERCEESNQISVLPSPAMNVHSEERHPRQEEGWDMKGKDGEEVPSLEGD